MPRQVLKTPPLPLPPPSESIHLALNEAIAELRSLSSVQSAADVSFVAATLRQLHSVGALPGYTTPEQLVDLDCPTVDWSQLASDEYAALLAQLARLFTPDWPEPEADGDILNMFKLDHSSGYVQVAFETLLKQLERVPSRASCLLAALLQDERLLAICLLHLARQRGALMQRFARTIKLMPEPRLEQHDEQIMQFIQLLMGLPSLVANKLGRQMPAIFAASAYGRLLLRQWLKAVHFVLQCEDNTGHFDLSPFSWLLSRVLANFHDASNVECLLRVLEDLAIAPKPRNVVQQILRELEPTACFKLAQSALSIQLNLYVLLGTIALESPHWQHCLLQKLPLQRTPIENGALCSLVGYLNVVAPTQLQLLFTQLLGIWSSRISLQKLSSQEHVAISKMLVLTGKYGGMLQAGHKCQLHDGLSHHLQSPDMVQRYVGMKTVELLYNCILDPNAKNEDYLHFNYVSMEQTPHWHILEELENLVLPSKEQLDAQPSCELMQRLELHMAQFMGEQVQQVQSNSPQTQPAATTTTTTAAIMQLDLDSDDDETPAQIVDEDDDLQPYDMSNDISSSLEQRPKFILDLLHLLRTKVANCEIFESALSTAEQLIRSQLAQQDVKLAQELMQLFITLEMQYYFENFEITQFQCCVAICVAQPAACAELLCREFHTDNTRYASKVRILILQVLAAAAKELAGDQHQPSPTNAEILDIVPTAAKQRRKFMLHPDEDAAAARLLAAQRIIRERLRSKTRRFLSKHKIPEAQAKMNPFHAVAGTFFFGLVRGQRTRQMLYVKYDNISHDIETLLLINMLHTLAVLVMCAQNCPLLPAMTREIFDLCAFVRFSAEARVRAATLQLLGTALVTMPAHLLAAHSAESLNELRRWLEEFVRSPLVGGESSDECRELAEQILGTCYKLYDTAVLEQSQQY
ncbi:GH20428 [Drosophila grimshawi]|uniref:GH20428 n=2 Tax=Drosophila grimshawi TaxID=7222 RepID=B4JRB4_DROGR|nr:GH20428 [Drosophila grimshawi]